MRSPCTDMARQRSQVTDVFRTSWRTPWPRRCLDRVEASSRYGSRGGWAAWRGQPEPPRPPPRGARGPTDGAGGRCATGASGEQPSGPPGAVAGLPRSISAWAPWPLFSCRSTLRTHPSRCFTSSLPRAGKRAASFPAPAPSRPAKDGVPPRHRKEARRQGSPARSTPRANSARRPRAPEKRRGHRWAPPSLGLVARGSLNDPAPVYILTVDLARRATADTSPRRRRRC